ncbi:MAG TPA: hypothetical protein VLW75_04610 [Rhizomicrobium sp.]|nr:hypothetical protein [Rhizomicrobium sp.]
MTIRSSKPAQGQCVVIPFPVERLRKFECSYDGEAEIHSPARERAMPAWWLLSFTLASLTLWMWIASRLI